MKARRKDRMNIWFFSTSEIMPRKNGDYKSPNTDKTQRVKNNTK